MSASLVGSEMCIRDSSTLVRRPLGVGSEGAPGSLRGGGLPVPRQRVGPVSYTHLTLPTICSV
eukprot:8279414-Alexandrium_andersonii.AAC.1